MTIDELRSYKRILILGYGLEGQATGRFIRKFHPDAEVGIADRKDDPTYLDRQKDYDLAVRTPLLRPHLVTIPYTTGTNLFFGNVRNVIIGVTGTKGKSTSVSLLYHILHETGKQVRLLGNIGKPMLDAVTDGIAENEQFILELSSYQLEDITYSPHIACFLNMYDESHNHTSFDEYFRAKSNITLHQNDDDWFYYNGAIHNIDWVLRKTKAKTVDFTRYDLKDTKEKLPFRTDQDNLKAVFSILSGMGIDESIAFEKAQTFVPLPHRLHTVGTYGGITFVDDSGSTHPSSTVLALREVGPVDTIMLGGQDRQYDFSELALALKEASVGHVILFPETGNKIRSAIEGITDFDPDICSAATMQEAVGYAFEHTRKAHVCLLSPGAPSYTMYTNLSERGDDFVRIIEAYAAEKKTTQTENIQEKS